MDKHIAPGILARHAAEAHQKDLEIQHEHGCNCMTYWVDEDRGYAFCLIEAPDIRAVKEMHDRAHGLVPHEIIEVDRNVVLSFLGRIHDPAPDRDSPYPIISDPGYRAILVAEVRDGLLRLVGPGAAETSALASKFYQLFNHEVRAHTGNVIEVEDSVLASFSSIGDAVHCVLALSDAMRTLRQESRDLTVSFGLSAGSPVTSNRSIFGEAIQTGRRLAFIAAPGGIQATSEIKEMYKGPRMTELSDVEHIRFLSVRQTTFLNRLFDVIDEALSDHKLRKADLAKRLGISGSKLYRLSVALTGMAPNDLLKEMRLRHAARLLQEDGVQVSEACYDAGFSSPSYFTKCFKGRFGILPTDFVQRMHKDNASF